MSDNLTFPENELSSPELAWFASLDSHDRCISYSMDVHVTVDNWMVEASHIYQCECDIGNVRADELWMHQDDNCEIESEEIRDCPHTFFHTKKLDKYNSVRLYRENWKVNAGEGIVPEGLADILDIDISDIEVDEWCGEYMVNTVTGNLTINGNDHTKLESLNKFYNFYGGVNEVPVCDTMGILDATGIWPAKSVEHLEEGWYPTPIFAGSLYISDPRLFVKIVEAS